MLTCFKCKKVINDPESLFRHIKEEHKISGKRCAVQCTLCWATFTDFSTFQKISYVVLLICQSTRKCMKKV